MRILLAFAAIFAMASVSWGSSGLVVHTAEFGVGKFHRIDNQTHPYAAGSAWLPYVLPQNAATDKPLVVSNADGSVTVFFSTLDELIASVIQVSHQRRQPVSVLNVHGHGLPGTMWFPNDAAALQSSGCQQWKDAVSGSDQTNYDQYYSAVSPDEIQQIREVADIPGIPLTTCTTGLSEWQSGVAKAPELKQVFASDAQIHFLSCVVGLGQRGQEFTQGIADLLLPQGGAGRVETSMDFGLGDWSIPEGMGFWDMQSTDQVNHDNEIYVKDRKDREIAQKGTVRLVSYAARGWQSTLLADQDFLRLGFQPAITGRVVAEPPRVASRPLDRRIRLPGTTVYLDLKP